MEHCSSAPVEGQNWFDADDDDLRTFLEDHQLPYAMEVDPVENPGYGIFHIRYYGEGHINNAVFDECDGRSELQLLLANPDDKELYTRLQNTYNPPILPRDMPFTDEHNAFVVKLLLVGLDNL